MEKIRLDLLEEELQAEAETADNEKLLQFKKKQRHAQPCHRCMFVGVTLAIVTFLMGWPWLLKENNENYEWLKSHVRQT